MDARNKKAKRKLLQLALPCALAAIITLTPWASTAGTFELSAGASFSQSDYGNGSFAWNRRIGGSFGYFFLSITEIELSFQDAMERTKIIGYQDTTVHDMMFGLSIVQSLVPKSFPIQPYLKLGGGQLIREAQGTYAGGAAPPAAFGTITVILGAGLKIYITQNFAIKGEATTYIAGAVLSTWKDNFGITGGVSFFF